MRQWSSLTDAATSLDNDFSRAHVSRVGVSLVLFPSRDSLVGVLEVSRVAAKASCWLGRRGRRWKVNGRQDWRSMTASF